MTRIEKFFESEKIPFINIFYFLRLDGQELKKIPMGEKNNLTIEEIEERKDYIPPKDRYYDLKLRKTVILTDEEEIKTVTPAYSAFLKHTENIYCIDVDDKRFKSLDDVVEKLNMEFVKDCPWIPGNTKGLHIYIKVKNMVSYSDQQNVYNDFEGDFIKKNNMWEKPTKKVMNYKNFIPEVDFQDIKHIFNSKINREKVEKKEKKDKFSTVLTTSTLLNPDQTKAEKWFNLALEYKVFENMNGRDRWINIGFIVKNIFGDDGIDLFLKVSKQYPKYDGEDDTRATYKTLNKSTLPKDKKPVTLKTLFKYIQETDMEIYKKILMETKEDDSECDFEIDENHTSLFSTDYFHTLNTYQQRKKYFEIFVCKVLRPQPLFIYSESDNDSYNCLLYSEQEIKATFKHLGSSILKMKGKDDAVETKFIDTWLDDKNIRLYNNMDFLPYNGCRELKDTTKSTTFNLFNGYNKVILSEYDKTKKDAILKPFKDLLFELCGGKDEYSSYLYHFLAHLIQKPNERIPLCFIIKSKQGVGKNVMLDAVGNLIGKHHFITSSKASDFFGEYAEGFYRKLLVNLNECEGKDTFDYEGKIKSYITENSITLNPKFVRQTTVSNYSRLIIFTNKPNPIPIDVRSKDRRFVVFQSTEKYLDPKYGTTFWTKLVNHFKQPSFIACLYDDLNSLDIENMKWIEKRPITEAYLEMIKLYVPIEASFLENYIEEHKFLFGEDEDEPTYDAEFYENEQDISTTEFYNKYVCFCRKFGYINDNSFQPNITKFNNRINELSLGIRKVRTSSGNIFRFTPKDIHQLMKEKKWIVKDENDIDTEELKDIGGDSFDEYFVL